MWKAIGRGVKRLPWRKIAKYGGAAIGVPVIATQTGANDEINELVSGALSPVLEAALILAQASLGFIGAWLRERAKDKAAAE